MAGRPLRPATRRRLGRPSPHQQADRPRAHPQPKNLSTNPHAREDEYPVLAPVSEGYPKARGRLLTCYSPVRRSSTPERAFPLDLHVLSTPPAFVLSQDQTLQQKPVEKSTPAKNTQKTRVQIAKGIPTTTPKGNGTGSNKTWHWHIKNTLLSSQRTTTHQHQPTQAGRHRGNHPNLPDRFRVGQIRIHSRIDHAPLGIARLRTDAAR